MSQVQSIEIARIVVEGRKRAVSPEKVADIQRSIRQQGLLQPIGVRAEQGKYRLIFGAHRLAAFQEAQQPEIPAVVFPSEMTDDECLLAEIQENLARNDLTGAERKAFAAEVGRLSLSLYQESSDSGESSLDSKWFVDFYGKSGLSKATAHNWWKSFCADTGRSITPKQAAPDDKAAFFDWLEEAKAKAEAERAEKERKAEEDRQRREREAWEKRLAEEKAELMKYLGATANIVGAGTLTTWLYAWIEETEDAK